jgi:class 3 adenylate cyclase
VHPAVQRRSGTRGLGAVLFTDIVGSTVIAAEMRNTRWAELLMRHHSDGTPDRVGDG